MKREGFFRGVQACVGAMALCVLVLFNSCNQSPQSALIWTDIPELVVAAQLFNRENDQFAVDVEYKENAATALMKTNKPPSLIIAKFLLSKPVIRKLDPLDDLFSRYYVDPNDMYSALLDAGKQGVQQILLPVSFDCMVLVERKSDSLGAGASMLDLDAIREAGDKFTRTEKGVLSAMGFSSVWNMEFAESWLLAQDAGFSPNPNWKQTSVPKSGDAKTWPLLWNKDRLEQSVLALNSLDSKVKKDDADAFAFSYFNKPGYQLVLENRVLFWPMKASDFFKLPYSAKSQLRYRYPAANQKLILTEGTRYLGVPKGAKGKKAAFAFSKWLLTPANQEKIWKEMETQRLLPDHVGPLDGFSSLKQTNETVLSRYFPEYAQNKIVAGTLRSPVALPDYWDSFSRDFFEVWLKTMLTRGEGTESDAQKGTIGEDFQASFEQYLGTMPDWLASSR